LTTLAPRIYFNLYRAFNIYQKGLALLPRVWLGLIVAELGLSFMDDAATRWLNNSQPIPASTVDRGMKLHNVAGGNLSWNFPKIDDWQPKVGSATSVRTHGNASSNALLNSIRKDLNHIYDIERKPLGGNTANGRLIEIKPGQIQIKNLLVGVPKNQAHWLRVQTFRDSIRKLQTQYNTVIKVVPVKGWKK